MSDLNGILRRGLIGALALVMCMAATPGGRPQTGLRVEPLEVVTMQGVQRFRVEIADTDATRQTGMMWRTRVGPNEGMLFDFKAPRDGVAFWMKNTLIPLDIIFISPQGRIVSIARNTTPLSLTPIPAGGTVLGVLEVGGGRAAAVGMLPGDLVRQRIFTRVQR